MNSSPNRTAQLGCGTLIVIAIIVAIFSNTGIDRKLDERVERLEDRLESIEAKIDAISEVLDVPPPPSVPGEQSAPAPVIEGTAPPATPNGPER